VLGQGCTSGDDSASTEIATLTEELAAMQAQVSELQAALDTARGEAEVAADAAQELEDEVESLQGQIDRNQRQREDLRSATARYALAESRLEALIDAIAPYPAWDGGTEIAVGSPWRKLIILSGCGWDYFGTYNGVKWFVASAESEPPDSYPAGWNVEVLTFADGPRLTMDGVIVLTAEGVIEATTLWGAPVATYAPSNKPAPVCQGD
jgi:hypothetical protein